MMMGGAWSGRGLGHVIRIKPDISDRKLLRLFHLGARISWTSEDYPEFLPSGVEPRAALALAHLMTPVYLGEQSAMLGANRAIAYFSEHRDMSYVVYLSTFMVDEARHLEAITRLYDGLQTDPLAIRDLPDMLRYHHRMRAGQEIATWVFGIMVSDLFAKHFYRALAVLYKDAPLGHMAVRVIQDESRHQAFAEHYLRANLPTLSDDRYTELWDLKEDLLRIIGNMARSLGDDARALGISAPELFDRFATDVSEHSRRMGLKARCRRCPLEGGPPPDWSQLAGEGGCACEAFSRTVAREG